MKRSTAIWTLGIVGWAVSYAMFAKWLASNRWDFFGGWVEAFTSSEFATGLLLDLVVSSGMLIVVALWDRRRLGPGFTAAVIACLALSASMSLAVYLVGILRQDRALEPSRTA